MREKVPSNENNNDNRNNTLSFLKTCLKLQTLHSKLMTVLCFHQLPCGDICINYLIWLCMLPWNAAHKIVILHQTLKLNSKHNFNKCASFSPPCFDSEILLLYFNAILLCLCIFIIIFLSMDIQGIYFKFINVYVALWILYSALRLF